VTFIAVGVGGGDELVFVVTDDVRSAQRARNFFGHEPRLRTSARRLPARRRET
jgi:hypothetical protein